MTIDHVFNNCPAVVSDNIKGVRELTEYVISMGHKKIAYIHGQQNSVTKVRLASFIAPWRNMELSVQMNMCQRHHILRESKFRGNEEASCTEKSAYLHSVS